MAGASITEKYPAPGDAEMIEDAKTLETASYTREEERR